MFGLIYYILYTYLNRIFNGGFMFLDTNNDRLSTYIDVNYHTNVRCLEENVSSGCDSVCPKIRVYNNQTSYWVLYTKSRI